MTRKRKPTKNKKRRSFTVDQKAEILRRHLSDKVPVSDLCEEYNIQPSVFYGWQRQLLDNLQAALVDSRKRDTQERVLARKIDALEKNLAKKNDVIAEISEEYVQLKKALGEP